MIAKIEEAVILLGFDLRKSNFKVLITGSLVLSQDIILS